MTKREEMTRMTPCQMIQLRLTAANTQYKISGETEDPCTYKHVVKRDVSLRSSPTSLNSLESNPQ